MSIGSNLKEYAKNSGVSVFDIGTLVELLDCLGYYKYIDRSIVDIIKANSIQQGCIYGGEGSGRDFRAQAEKLAEWQAEEFFISIKAFLAAQKVKAKVTADHIYNGGYAIRVNNRSSIIYTDREFCTQDIWILSTYRVFAITNRLLENAGSDERAYVLYGGGNRQRCIFLTSELYDAIASFPGIPESEVPVLLKYELQPSD